MAENVSMPSDLPPSRLVNLLRSTQEAGGDPESRVGDEGKGEMLARWLTQPVPLPSDAQHDARCLLDRACESDSNAEANTIDTLFTHPRSLEAIRLTKHEAKAVASLKGPDHDPAVVVYYAAIAVALIRYDCLITSHDLARLHRAFGRLLKLDWVPQRLLQLFGDAQAHCASD